MSRRDHQGQYARRQSPAMIVLIWLGTFASLGLLAVMALAVRSDFAGFRPCSTNSSGLSVATCGKNSVNPGDILLLVLFGLSALLVVTLLTAAWRTVRRRA